MNEAISAVSGAQSRALKGVILDPAEITKLKDVLGNAEVAVSRQLEVLVAKENARSPQEDSFPEGYVKQNAEYFKSLANQSPKAVSVQVQESGNRRRQRCQRRFPDFG